MTERLRIAQVAPIARGVTPDSASSIEQIVSLLTEELVRRGHAVTLFASGESRTSAALHAVYPRGYHHDPQLWNHWEFHEVMHAAAAFERAREFDVIHCHDYHYALPFARLADTPAVHSYHIVPSADVLRCYASYPGAQLVALSCYHRGKFGDGGDIPVIYNGIDTNCFPFRPSPGDYLLFLGHLTLNKGAAQAVQVARKAGMRLILAGQASDQEYFDAELAPLIDGRWVTYVGPVGVTERNALLANAAALIFPSVYSEAFGLVLVEAAACGTPVAAFRRCAVPEIVEPGVTGHYAEDVDTLAACIPETVALDRTRVRQEAVRRFDHRRMVDEYETLYREVLARRGGRRGHWAA